MNGNRFTILYTLFILQVIILIQPISGSLIQSISLGIDKVMVTASYTETRILTEHANKKWYGRN